MGLMGALTWVVQNAAIALGFLLVLAIIGLIGFVLIKGMVGIITGDKK